MNAFWRKEPLTEPEQKLLGLLYSAHEQSSFRDNVSSATVVNVIAASGSYTNAIASAILTLGGVHAPLEQTIQFLQSIGDEVSLPEGKVPGWGNSFIKGGADPVWKAYEDHLSEVAPDLKAKIDSVTERLHAKGKNIYPNPSTWTSACAIVLQVPPKIAPMLFIQARLSAWSFLALQQLNHKGNT